MEDFKRTIKSFQSLLQKIKDECAVLDKAKHKENVAEVIFMLKKKYKEKIDSFFEDLWKLSDYAKENYEEKAEYLRKELDPFFYDNIETISYIRDRPLGYVGDFVTMNFIYDFNEGNFLGKSYYQKFINNYSCSTKTSSSNIGRKRVLKKQLAEKD